MGGTAVFWIASTFTILVAGGAIGFTVWVNNFCETVDGDCPSNAPTYIMLSIAIINQITFSWKYYKFRKQRKADRNRVRSNGLVTTETHGLQTMPIQSVITNDSLYMAAPLPSPHSQKQDAHKYAPIATPTDQFGSNNVHQYYHTPYEADYRQPMNQALPYSCAEPQSQGRV